MKVNKALFQSLSLAAAITFIGHGLTAFGATANVTVSPSGALNFSPATANINVNDSVVWTWSGSGHSTTSSGASAGLWDSGVVNAPHTFTNTFPTAGTFSYVCTPHAGLGMVGSIVVTPVTANVQIASSGLTFTPATASIPVNGRVIWTWVGSGHSTTSGSTGTPTGDGLWNSGVANAPHSFTNSFASAGTFAYYCIPHFNSGMRGSIVVTNLTVITPNVPPTVTLTNPASGVTLSAPASLTLKANAADSDGSITNVQFLQGTTSLGQVAAAPFSFAVNNLPAATYTFSAIASDNLGATATNSITVHVINASPVAVGTAKFVSANNFQFSYNADIGLTYLVLVSTNLLNWTPVNTNTATVNPTIFTDPNAGRSGAYYRIGRLPNP